MTKESDDFEKIITRIHKLIEKKGSVIKWNDKIPDPHNINQLRQIDITIKRDRVFTAIECRIHKKPQDIKWIEELIGRRLSLKIDIMIAVSSSGFTKGAVIKANEFGIFLRDLRTLKDEEIKSWGCKTSVYMQYMKYRNILLYVIMEDKYKQYFFLDNFCMYLKENGIFNDILFAVQNGILNNIKNQDLLNYRPIIIEIVIPKNKCVFDKIKVIKFFFQSEVKIITQYNKIPSVMVYDDPLICPTERLIKIENSEYNDINIIKNLNEFSLQLDWDLINHPVDCIFINIKCDMKKPMCLKSLNFIGRKRLIKDFKEIKIRTAYVSITEEPKREITSEMLDLKSFINNLGTTTI
jgi:hypothetical protein